MVRLFQRHHKRNTRLLDGLWQFKIDPDLRGVKEDWKVKELFINH